MIIKDIRLINFGKFHDTEIHFERGLNIVYGENEAGKTTIHTFIRGMLFGSVEKPAEKIHIPNMNHGLILKYIVE